MSSSNNSRCTVVSITNQKGGVGKTTTTASMAAGLKSLGYRVLVIDLDPQGNLGFSVGAHSDGATIYDVLKGDVIARFAIQRTSATDIIVSNILLSSIELEFTGSGREFLLKKAINPIKEMYDYILLDTPPALSILTINAFTASDYIVVPMLTDIFSLQGISQLHETVERIKKHSNPTLRFAGILLTNYNPSTRLAKEIRGTAELIASQYKIPLFNTAIRKSVVVSEAQSMQSSLLAYAPTNNATQDYQGFLEEFLTFIEE